MAEPRRANAFATGTVEQALDHALRLLEHHPALAADQLDEILQVVPEHPIALRLLAAARLSQGNLQDALDILLSLARNQPNWAVLHFDLGVALGRAGRAQKAINALRRAVKLRPEMPQAWRVLGDHLLAAGERDAAHAAYANHVRYSGHDPNLQDVASALAENHISVAEGLLREHLKQAPTDVVALYMAAEIAARLGRNENAIHLLTRCLELAPDFHAARKNYALYLNRNDQSEEALVELEQLLVDRPGYAAYLNLKAVVQYRIGNYESATRIYADLLRRYPGETKLWLSYGNVLKTIGQCDCAVDAYRHGLGLEPSFGELWWSLANLKTFNFRADDLAKMGQQLVRPDLSEDDRLHLEFAMGNALEDIEDYEESFQHYAQGNAMRRGRLHYSADETSTRARRICAQYTHDFFAARAGAGCLACDPIFIVGLPRAGSTLIEQILASHSMVEGTMELPALTSITRLLSAKSDGTATVSYHYALAELDTHTLKALGEGYLARTRVQRKTTKPMFIDKMPNNFMHIGLIQLILPNARIIDARRNPMACGFSLFKQLFARGQDFSYDLEDIGRYYSDYVMLMEHFNRVLPNRIYRVTYENMVNDTEAEIRNLLAYCDLPFEDSCTRFFENPRPVHTASSEQVREPIYRGGVDHWQHYAPWLGPLERALVSLPT